MRRPVQPLMRDNSQRAECTPVGYWSIETLKDYLDVQEGRADKPCYRVRCTDGFQAIVWGWGSPLNILRDFIWDFWGAHAVEDVRYRT